MREGAIISCMADVEGGLAALLDLDPRLKRVAEESGPLPLRLADPGYAGLAHVIVSQMVSRASADAIWARIVAATGGPTAEGFLALDEATIATLGLSRAKASTLRRVAEAVSKGELDLSGIVTLSGAEATSRLTALKGIGPWTADVYLMFCGGHADIFPAGDVALRAAVGSVFGHETRPDIDEVERLALIWSPWRSIAARLFWAYYATRMGRDATPL